MGKTTMSATYIKPNMRETNITAPSKAWNRVILRAKSPIAGREVA